MIKTNGLTIIAAICAFCASFANAADKKVNDALFFAPPASVGLEGALGAEMQTSLKGDILVWNIDDLILPFQTRLEEKHWRTEFWGKWITSAELAYDFAPSKKLGERLDYAVSGLLKTQGADGSITSYKQGFEYKNWDVWGRKYVMLGLLADYRRTGDKNTLEAVKRHADVIIQNIGEGKLDITKIDWWEGMAAGSILEPFVLLYDASGDPRYLDFANYIVSSWSRGPRLVEKALDGVSVFDMFKKPDPKNPKYGIDGKSKSYEMMSCYEGLVELYRVTAKPEYKKAAENIAKSIREREITVIGSGSIWERWADGRFQQQRETDHWMETCVTATWIKLCAQLLRLTGDSIYANSIELAAYNALIGAQKDDGTWWSHYSPMNGERHPAPEQCQIHMNCCVASGPRGLFLLPKLAYMGSDNGVVINFYEKGKAAMPASGGKVKLINSGADFISENSASVKIESSGAKAPFEIKFRIPEWSKTTKVTLNGEEIKGAQAGQYLAIKRDWKAGDSVKIDFDAAVRIEKDPASEKLALLKGPYVLAQDKRFEAAFDKPLKLKLENGKPVVKLAKIEGVIGAFDVELEDGSARRFICYPSAGSTWSEESAFRVWFENK